MDTEGRVRTGLELRVGKGLGDPKTVVNGERLRDWQMGSWLDSCPRALEMVLKHVYTLLSSWNRFEDFDHIFWGQKNTLAGQWFPRSL